MGYKCCRHIIKSYMGAVIVRIDFASLAFGYIVKVGGSTPNWATSLGQGKDYKINDSSDINELLKGMIYTSVSLSKVTSRIGKGGSSVSGNADDSPIIMASVFQKVYINDMQIIGENYILLITRDTSKSHAGRLRFKYGPGNSYKENGKVYSNEDFWNAAKKQLHLNENACFFVYDISVNNQNELKLGTVIVNPNGKVEYVDSTNLHAIWNALIEEDEKKKGRKPSDESKKTGSIANMNDINPEWFKKKSIAFPTLDDETNVFLTKFKRMFSPEKLKSLSSKEILNTIFLNSENKSNLCYVLEFDNECKHIFGSIRSGTVYKYGLHYSQKHKTWATGTSKKLIFLTQDEAIELGTQIRDKLIAGYELIADAGEIKSLNDYQNLYNDLYNITDGYINRMWFMKYYALLFPEFFPPIYSLAAQTKVLNKLSIPVGSNVVYRMGQIRNYANKCNISNVMFIKIFWTYCSGDEEKDELDRNNEIESSEVLIKTCFDIVKKPRTAKIFPINFIVYGAPGTGKTYSMVEYSLAIIDNVSIEKFKNNNTDREKNFFRYKKLISEGQIVFTTFHQNYGYEEFIQGLRPENNGEIMSFKIFDGIFKTIADRALNDTEERNYVIIIDEINRANISKVFGELITLIEEDKRWGESNETSVTLQSGDPFTVPNNLYIIGTMNSADKSISLIDTALRRRFAFIEQRPDSSLVSKGVLRNIFDSINETLVYELDSTDLLIGHSYFMAKEEKDLCDILNNNIIPLLYEYFYDNRKKVATLLKSVIDKSGAKIEIVGEKFGRLSVTNRVD